jgi:hypothetical protein
MFLDSRQEDKTVLNWVVVSIAQIHSALNFYMNQMFISHCYTHMFLRATFSEDLLIYPVFWLQVMYNRAK